MHQREKRWRQSPKGKTKRNAAQRRRRRANPLVQRNWRLLRYGLTHADYEKMLQEHAHCCAICFRTEAANQFGRLRVDHDHKTGKIRGLLCHHCNVALGHFGDCVPVIENALYYLRKNGASETGL